jgi:lysophospholipase L1-like esterase
MRSIRPSAALIAIALGHVLWVWAGAADSPSYPDPKRFEGAIQAFQDGDKTDPPPQGAIVCTGSSSMRLWHGSIRQDLAPLVVIPRGFGGSMMNDLLHYADRVIVAHRPRAVVVYEGDNDIAAGIPPEKIRDTFRALAAKIHESLPETRVYFLSIKPSVKRWDKWPKMKEANALIAKECSRDGLLTYVDVSTPMLDAEGKVRSDLFKADNLHMNEKGYAVWRDVLRPLLIERESGACRGPGAR